MQSHVVIDTEFPEFLGGAAHAVQPRTIAAPAICGLDAAGLRGVRPQRGFRFVEHRAQVADDIRERRRQRHLNLVHAQRRRTVR